MFDPDRPRPLRNLLLLDPDRPQPLSETNGSPLSLGVAEYKAKRFGRTLILVASGEATAGTTFEFVQAPFLIYPPQFWFIAAPPTGINTGQMVPFLRPSQPFVYPSDAPVVTIKDAAGRHVVEIDDYRGRDAANLVGDGAFEGVSPVSMEDALNTAVAIAESETETPPDAALRHTIVEMGKLRGTFAGVDLYFVRITLSVDS